MKHIVIIHAGAVGDLVQALPAMAAVRAARPEATVTLVGRPERASLAVLAGAAERIVDLETCGLWRLMGEAADAPALHVLDGADLVVDLLTKGALAAGLEKSTAGQACPEPAERGRPWHTYTCHPERSRGVSPFDTPKSTDNGEVPPLVPTAPGLGRNDRLVVSVDPLPPEGWDRSAAAWIAGQVGEALGLDAPCETPCIRLPQTAEDAARTLLASRGVGERFVAVHPGSGSTTKNWPPDRFEAVARRVRQETSRGIVWLAGPAEQERGTLPPGASGDTVLTDLALVEVAGLLALADAYLGNDSGITQIAAAVRRRDGRTTPTVALFGPTDPRVWAPCGEHVRVVAAADGKMESIGVEEVGEAVAAMLIR